MDAVHRGILEGLDVKPNTAPKKKKPPPPREKRPPAPTPPPAAAAAASPKEDDNSVMDISIERTRKQADQVLKQLQEGQQALPLGHPAVAAMESVKTMLMNLQRQYENSMRLMAVHIFENHRTMPCAEQEASGLFAGVFQQ
jgi:hypothetical protein